MTLEELTDIFRRLGANNPERWAGSQIREQIPQLGRFLVLRAMWDCVTRAGTTDRIDYGLKHGRDAPHIRALQAMLKAGVSKEAITSLARFKQAELLQEFCYLLEDYSSVPQNSIPKTGKEYVRWSLREIDADGKPMERPIDGLHESFWSLDPSPLASQQS